MRIIRSVDDIMNFIIGENESLRLEFKRSAALAKSSEKRSELIKDISALANSAGGQIIYGIEEKDGKAMRIDEGIDHRIFSEEWIQQIIESNTSPRIQELSIERIEIDPDRCLYVITVPQATLYAPHQNLFDKKYYRRFERISVAMADYEIRHSMRRSKEGNNIFDSVRAEPCMMRRWQRKAKAPDVYQRLGLSSVG